MLKISGKITRSLLDSIIGDYWQNKSWALRNSINAIFINKDLQKCDQSSITSQKCRLSNTSVLQAERKSSKLKLSNTALRIEVSHVQWCLIKKHKRTVGILISQRFRNNLNFCYFYSYRTSPIELKAAMLEQTKIKHA